MKMTVELCSVEEAAAFFALIRGEAVPPALHAEIEEQTVVADQVADELAKP